MHNLTIKTVRTVTCDFSADQWGLLTVSFPRAEIQNIADELNRYLMDLVNNDYDLRGAEILMHAKMRAYSKYGAYDTEPREFLEIILREIYASV